MTIVKAGRILAIIAVLPTIVFGQINTKTKEEYSYSTTKANEVQAKKTVKLADIPDYNSFVSLNQSGDGIINVPVVNVKGKKLNMPITLNYVTSGIKVRQHASEVGLGWSMNIGSIVRDYGAFEPDYTYTGSEFQMKYYTNHGAPTGNDKQLQPAGSVPPINPINHNRTLEYTGVTSGIAPDEYIINVPGLQGNSFWNYNPSGSSQSTVNFVFTEKVPWKIDHQVYDFVFPQEVSRINEFDYFQNSSSTLNTSHNFASAIGFYPYVKNNSFEKCIQWPEYPTSGASTSSNIQYQDYSKFTVTTDDGTRYVFGKTLRGQKYIIDEEPFWCTMNANPFFGSNPPSYNQSASYGEFWKTDYVAEWLLTEVLSNDYVDVNSNGPDDLDKGDWVKIDYTQTYKEWLNYSQTDKASSLFRERAYVSKITTPVQQLDFTTVVKNDIDNDHFSSVFNRVLNDYVYNGKTVGGTAINAKHPIEERCYTSIIETATVASQTIKTILFNYAASGSSEELCGSHYYIIDNSMNYVSYDPSTNGVGLDANSFSHTQTKGKKTLLGLTIKNSANNVEYEYKFKYGKNPSYDEIALQNIRKMGAWPTIRESMRSSTLRWSGVKTLNGGTPIAHTLLPWKWAQIDIDKNLTMFMNTSSAIDMSSAVHAQYDWYHVVYEDEMGYLMNGVNHQTNQPIFNRDAWTLSEIVLPYSGKIQLTYENDMFELLDDRNEWKKIGSIPDYCIPSVGHYNNVAHMRSIKQGIEGSSKHKYREFYYLMNETSGGIRIKRIDYSDPYSQSGIFKTFEYGKGHYPVPPADYYQNYLSGLGSFIYSEMSRHEYNEFYQPWYENLTIPYKYNEYKEYMARLVAGGTRIDNSIKKLGQHYYEYIDEKANDWSKTRRYYGRLIPDNSPGTPESKRRLIYYRLGNPAIKGEFSDRVNLVELLSTSIDNYFKTGNYKTELIDKYGNMVQHYNSEYEYSSICDNSVSTSEQGLLAVTYPLFGKFNYSNDEDHNLCTQTGSPWIPNHPDVDNQYSTSYGSSWINDMGYQYSGAGLISSTGLSRNTLLTIGLACGEYTSSPGFLSSIVSTNQPWTISNSQMKLNFDNNIFNHSKRKTTGNYAQMNGVNIYNYIKDANYYIAPETIRTQQSYIMRPKSSTTTTKY